MSKSSVGRVKSLPPSFKSQYRLVVLGAAGVGKTSIITRFLYEEFVAEYIATVEEMHRGEYELGGLPLTLDILDTTGSYPFPAMRQLSITTGDAFILVYSIHDESSFDEVTRLRQQIIDTKSADSLTPIVIVGNKTDLGGERQVRKEFAESMASIDWGHAYVEASAKDDCNIAGIFKELLKQANFQISAETKLRKVGRKLENPLTISRANKQKPKAKLCRTKSCAPS